MEISTSVVKLDITRDFYSLVSSSNLDGGSKKIKLYVGFKN
jgi:hypothetical protein